MTEPMNQTDSQTTQFSIPSAAHKELLREIQNTAKQCADMLEAHRIVGEVTGTIAPQSFYSVYQRHADRGRDLEAIARAGGIPANWIAQVRSKGEQSVAWRDGHKYWPTPDPVDRHALIAQLGTEARTLRTALAVAATGRIFNTTGERFWPVGHLDRFMTASWERIAGVGLLLNPTVAEREQIWPSGPDWSYSAVAAVHAWDSHALQDFATSQIGGDGKNPPIPAPLPDLAELALPDRDLIVAPLPELVHLVSTAHRSLAHPIEHLAGDAHTSTMAASPADGGAIAEAVAAAALGPGELATAGVDEVTIPPSEPAPVPLDLLGPDP